MQFLAFLGELRRRIRDCWSIDRHLGLTGAKLES
jgi:hypothetical protein